MLRRNRAYSAVRTVVMIISTIATVELIVHIFFYRSAIETWLPEAALIAVDVMLVSVASSLSLFFWVLRPLQLAEQQSIADEIIKAERDRLQKYLNLVGTIFVVIDRSQKIALINKKGCELLGYEEKELIGKNWFDLAIPDSIRENVKSVFVRLMSGELESAEYYENSILTRTGDTRIIAWHNAMVKDEQGVILCTLSSGEDITERKRVEQALKDSEAQLLESQRIAHIGSWEQNLQTNEVRWSDETYRLFGFDPQTTKPNFQSILDSLHPDDRDEFRRTTQVAVSEGTPYSADFRIRRVDGTEAVIHSRGEVLYDASGKPAFHRGTVQDITGRKHAEDLIKESEIRYHNLFDKAHEMIQSVAPDGRFLFVNPAWKNALGYSQEDLETLTIFDILDASCKPHCMDLFRKAISGQALDYFEAKFVAKNGRIIDIEGNASVNMVDGKVVATQGILRDVTERNKLEQQVFLAKQDWEETFNTITDMVTVHDKEYHIIRANKAAEKILGLPLLDVNKVKCFNYYHGTGCPPDGCPSCQSLITGKPSTSEMYEPHLNKYIEIRAIPRLDKKGDIAGLIHVVRDISERKKLEEQLFQAQKMEAVGQLAGGVAHDFNNILTAILGDVYILGMKLGAQNPLVQYVDDIRSSSEKAAALTQSLLAFSRKQIINPKPMDLNATVQKMQNLMIRIVGEDIILKTVQSAPDLIIMADGGQLEQVMMNLITNARDSMPQGGTLTISTGVKQLDETYIAKYGFGKVGTYALLSVADTGTGMDEKTRERIFEPFFTTKEVGKGTGLGLSMAYGIVKQHNGFIDCFSAPGSGTVFNIYLPLVDTTHSAADRLSTSVPERGKEYILLAEDDGKVRKTTKAIIEEFGYRVIEAVDGEDAVGKFIETGEAVQMVIMDVVMPRKNGKEAYEEMKALRPEVKVLFLSGYSADIIHKKGILDENLHFLSKPASPETLLSKIREVLDR